MSQKKIFIGNQKASFDAKEVKGNYVNKNSELYYKISNSDALTPFFMSIVSDSNHWLFVSSNGGISAGRKNSDHALFPYYTEDKIKESAETTGSKTILLVHKASKTLLWEPFSENYKGVYQIKRNLYKNAYGNKILFEEINDDLELTFCYEWNTSNLFGFVRKATLINNSNESNQITVLDGIQNILPQGLSSDLQNSFSNLVDAYKKNELESEIGLGIFSLSAIIVDKPEPSEALKANCVWSIGLDNATHLISSLQLNTFRQGAPIQQEIDIRAEKGAYFISSEIDIKAKEEKKWMIVANVNQGPSDMVAIAEKLKFKNKLYKEVLDDIELGTKHLIQITASADGLQHSADWLQNTRHFSNVLFNLMRGGIFDHNYQIEAEDFMLYLKKANIHVYANTKAVLKQLPSLFSVEHLREIAVHSGDSDFIRLCFEYMPLKFSRRHGDPSRPWNKFSINTRSEIDGSKVLDYEGNWRDIFQNWEALAHSYPNFIESMIHKFLNASTFEGYNPYRVMKEGFDWEVIEPDDPWSFIGYWGDHQIVYLLKFLEFSENHFPKRLETYFNQDVFVFAHVPYKIKSYADILENPKDTILFDAESNEKIQARKKDFGSDGALLTAKNGSIYKVTLIEKLMVSALAKCSNFIPDAGIWMNTQRPEWNDANNALVGNGASMVTLYYLRRYVHFFKAIVNDSETDHFQVSKELLDFFRQIATTLHQFQPFLASKITDETRKRIVDGLGKAGGDYRAKIYTNLHQGLKVKLSKVELNDFFDLALKYFDTTIAKNKRVDNLYHAYNLISIKNKDEIAIAHLPEMLEGQVAVLSSGFLTPIESLSVLYSLKNSALYRTDQNSYVLYPDKQLSRFMDKNGIPETEIKKSDLLVQLIKDDNRQIVEKDILGNYHFNGNFNNANSLKKALDKLPKAKYNDLIEKDKERILSTFEMVFNHKYFTGRSGTFFGYEGLGSIYWHMVSKLQLAVLESGGLAFLNKEDDRINRALINQYYEIKEGVGLHKSPKLYGAFPTDPYSHTPGGKGAQQPGMTGQVKEDILSRFAELGIFVKEGSLLINPILLKKEWFLKHQETFSYFNIAQQEEQIVLPKNALFFTYCQVPFVYKIAKNNAMEIHFENTKKIIKEELRLDVKTSQALFNRTGEIMKIVVSIGVHNFRSK